MSSCPSAALLYGVILDENDHLAKYFGLNPEDDCYDEIEGTVEDAGLTYQLLGNSVLGETVQCVSVVSMEIYGCGVQSIDPEEFFKIPQEKLEKLHSFLKKYNINIEPTWHLGVSYG